jgi:hypothetical protein
MDHRRISTIAGRSALVLALLVAVMSSPIRPTKAGAAHTMRDCLRRNFALPSSHATRLTLAAAPAPSARESVVRSEGEEDELEFAARAEACFIEIPAKASTPPARETAPLLPPRAPHPLRC